MRILVFTSQLWNLTGGEVNVRDWATGFKARGHSVIVYAPVAGPLADWVRTKGIPVISDPSRIADTPDVMFGSGINDAIALSARFPETPIVQVSQQWDSWASYPCPLPQVVLHVSVDELNAELLVNEFGIDRERVRVVHNAVDLSLLRERQRPLASTPERMLVIVKQNAAYIDDLQNICRQRGIALDLIGYAIGNPVDNPLEILGDYDIVVGAARTAIEATVAGAAVLVADHRGFAGMLCPSNLEHFRRHNFGREVLKQPTSAARLNAGIDAYDPGAASIASDIMRTTATLERQLVLLEGIFEESLILFNRGQIDPREYRKALSNYLAHHLPRHGESSPRHDRFPHLEPAADKVHRLERRLDRVEQQFAHAKAVHSGASSDIPPMVPFAEIWRSNTVIAESEIAACRLHRVTDGGTRIYCLEAHGGHGEHYVVLTLPPQHGRIVLSLDACKGPRVAGLRVQLLDDIPNGVIGDVDFSTPNRMTLVTFGHAVHASGGASPVEDDWLECRLEADFPVTGMPVRVILQLRDTDGSYDFLPSGQQMFLRAVRLRNRAGHATNTTETI